ncbi:unnamed protein product [Effrenium voratum]|nr:unnamed protein product [Effrenium voratum]
MRLKLRARPRPAHPARLDHCQPQEWFRRAMALKSRRVRWGSCKTPMATRQLGPRKLRSLDELRERLPFQGAAAKALQRVDAKAAAKGNRTRESSAEDGSNASNLCQGSFAGALKEISVTFSEELLKTEQAPDHFQSKA